MVPVSGLEAAAQIGLSPIKIWLKENKASIDVNCLIVKQQGVKKVENYCKDCFTIYK